MPAKDADVVVGLDIGTTKICTVVGEVDAQGRLTILGAGMAPSEGIRRGVVADIPAVVSSIRRSVEEAQRAADVRIQTVSVGVTGEHLTSVNARGVVAINNPHQEIGPEDVERVLENARAIVLPPDREILHNIPRGFIVDGLDGVMHPEGMSGARLEADTHIVTGARTFIDNVLKCVYSADLQVEGGGVVLEPLATAEAVLMPTERELGVCLVDVGGGTTDVAAFINGAIAYTGVVPAGGEHVTRDIAIGTHTSLAEAERVKLDWGTALADLLERDELISITTLGGDAPTEIPRSIVAEIIEARMLDLFERIKDMLRQAGALDVLATGAVITGGGSRLPGTAQVATDVLDVPVRLGAPSETLGAVDEVNHPRHATAVGLARLSARSLWAVPHARRTRASRPPGLLRRLQRLFDR